MIPLYMHNILIDVYVDFRVPPETCVPWTTCLMTIVMSLETSAVQLIGWVLVSNLLNQSLWSSFVHHRHAINFQEQGNGCHLIKMMSTMGYLFFFSEANVRTIWYLFVAFACRNWEFFTVFYLDYYFSAKTVYLIWCKKFEATNPL